MCFNSGRRKGKYWNDAILLNDLLINYNFNLSFSGERDFEIGLSGLLEGQKNKFNCNVISQTDKSTSVKSVYCFGKNHRPDITLGRNGSAIELKHINSTGLDGLKSAIGQGYLYRLQYRFVFLVLIIRKEHEEMYEQISKGGESKLENILEHLANQMNIFTYIMPSFKLKSGIKKHCSFFQNIDEC